MDLEQAATIHDTEVEKQKVIAFVQRAMMTMWFAGKVPADEHKWLEIARADAVGVVNSLAEAGYLNLTGEK